MNAYWEYVDYNATYSLFYYNNDKENNVDDTMNGQNNDIMTYSPKAEPNKKNSILGIFNDFFGEEFVDLQENDIIVYFPKVRVTNEHGGYIDIYKVFIKTTVKNDGTMNGLFSIIRTEYPEKQWLSRYMFSHCHRINYGDYDYDIPCLGSGPIKTTICSLNREYNEDLWKLYCFELKKYIETESIEGVPYIQLESVSRPNVEEENVENTNVFYHISDGIRRILAEIRFDVFIKKLIMSDKLKFSAIDGRYVTGQSFVSYVITISEEFIKWYNNILVEDKNNSLYYDYPRLLENNILIRAVRKNNTLYKPNGDNTYCSVINTTILEFKGVEYKLTINRDVDYSEEDNKVTIINPMIVSWLIEKMLNSLNYRYNRYGTEENVKYV